MTKANGTYGLVGGNIWLVCRPFLATYRTVTCLCPLSTGRAARVAST